MSLTNIERWWRMAGFVVDGMERTASLTFSVVVASVCCLFAALVFAGCASEPAAPKLTPEEMIEQKDAWADGVVRSALDKLADEGAIGKVSKTADLLVDAFEYEKIDNGYGIAFKDKALGKELSGAYTLPNGKVILCRTRTTGAKEAPFMTVYPEYADGDWVNELWARTCLCFIRRASTAISTKSVPKSFWRMSLPKPSPTVLTIATS